MPRSTSVCSPTKVSLPPNSDERRLALDTDRLLPPTLQALIAARLDLLRGDRKVLLQDAAVIGESLLVGRIGGHGRLQRKNGQGGAGRHGAG